ncbi:MAG TPA: hypothetical protein VLM76_09680 [Patescibacteria group bacterium]|nr:hypothetical protein [Patescibacteria group bacterium]
MSRTVPRPPRWFPVATLAIVMAFVGVGLFLSRPGPGAPVPWARLGTQDVHSLAFVGDDPQHLLFGHHNGIAETRDGGKTWAPLPVGEDAMGMVAADDGSIVIAGHLVFTASRDGGQTWAPISTDLPSLDIHGFTRDPSDPARMWAYLATGGLWESRDFGARFTRIRDDNVLYPTAVAARTGTRLFGVDASGLIVSDDGGRTWMALGQPPTYPMTAFAASADGTVLYAGAPDGLFRSGDGGRTWSATGYTSSAFAVATTPDGQSVGVVSQATEFFRSSDSGATWPGEE